MLAQEPWTYATKLRSKLRDWNLFQDIEKSNRPRACIYATPDLCCFPISTFSDEDIVAVRVKNVCRKGDSVVFVSAYSFRIISYCFPIGAGSLPAYMAAEEPAPPNLLRDLLPFTEN